MAANEIHKDMVGVQFIVTITDNNVVEDISSASVKQLWFKKPNGTLLTKDATYVTDGTDGKIYYTSESGDLNDDGTWELQGYVVQGSSIWYTDIQCFKVHRNLGS
jgi:hypothetical protein